MTAGRPDRAAPVVCQCGWPENDFAPEQPCGCGQENVRLYRDTAWHYDGGQHWRSGCLIAALHSEVADQAASLSALQAEIAKCLSPANENVKQGYWTAAVRDVAQVLVTSKDNARDAMQQLEKAEAEVTALRDHLAQAQAEIAQQLEELHRYYDAAKWWEAERAALQQQLENEAVNHEATRHELRQ